MILEDVLTQFTQTTLNIFSGEAQHDRCSDVRLCVSALISYVGVCRCCVIDKLDVDTSKMSLVRQALLYSSMINNKDSRINNTFLNTTIFKQYYLLFTYISEHASEEVIAEFDDCIEKFKYEDNLFI